MKMHEITEGIDAIELASGPYWENIGRDILMPFSQRLSQHFRRGNKEKVYTLHKDVFF